MNHKDVIKVLANWKHWKRMVEAPGRIDDLEARLQGMIAEPTPDTSPKCRRCGSHDIQVTKTDEYNATWRCNDCDHYEGRMFPDT